MSTASLFVELVVIGVGALSWVVLLVLSVFGWNWVPTERVFSSVALVPLLSLIYVFGIAAVYCLLFAVRCPLMRDSDSVFSFLHC